MKTKQENVCHKHGPTKSSICEKCLPESQERAGIKGHGYDVRAGGFTDVIIDGKEYPSAYIVRAVTTHEELLAALQGANDTLMQILAYVKFGNPANKEDARKTLDLVQKAIAKAEGR